MVPTYQTTTRWHSPDDQNMNFCCRDVIKFCTILILQSVLLQGSRTLKMKVHNNIRNTSVVLKVVSVARWKNRICQFANTNIVYKKFLFYETSSYLSFHILSVKASCVLECSLHLFIGRSIGFMKHKSNYFYLDPAFYIDIFNAWCNYVN